MTQLVEQLPATEIERELIAAQFRTVVEQAVEPIHRARGAGEFHFYYDSTVHAQVGIEIGPNDIQYTQFNPTEAGDGGGAHGLGFVPSHAVNIVSKTGFDRSVTGTTVFGLRQDGVIVRALAPSTGTSSFGRRVVRELDLEESQAFVSYITSPHLRHDEFDVMMRRNPEEEAEIQAALVVQAEAAEQLHRDLQAFEDARLKGLAMMAVDNTVIGSDA